MREQAGLDENGICSCGSCILVVSIRECSCIENSTICQMMYKFPCSLSFGFVQLATTYQPCTSRLKVEVSYEIVKTILMIHMFKISELGCMNPVLAAVEPVEILISTTWCISKASRMLSFNIKHRQIIKKTIKAKDQISEGYMAQMRGQPELDENGKQQSATGQIYVNVVPTHGNGKGKTKFNFLQQTVQVGVETGL
ncbi:hypothetical protein C5167_050964 [Papaver somniferum]|uniref:Uncharacterized protein n=1 Tax=Papaver somniferum TaxID=3469 RepID=A0A4Y7KRN5_PAPSO|nr:hypothetical protein C5167_050964 [Papaver somniferum]